MLYVERDENGQISALHRHPLPTATEEKAAADKEVLDFLDQTTASESWQILLSMSDMDSIRLLEDLVDLLVRKNIIIFTELPEKAQEKIIARKKIREKFSGQNDLMVDDII